MQNVFSASEFARYDRPIVGGFSIPETIGRYRVIRRMTTSTAADVFFATDEERDVVIKVLLDRFARDDRFAKRFEAASADYARLDHPAIVKLHEILSFEGRAAMVLEHVSGAPLPRLRGMLKAVGYDIDDSAALHLAAEICTALAAAHEARDASGAIAPVVHRYLSPSNVLVGWEGEVKLADFGLPKPVHHEREAGIAKGADGYMAPEQVTGEATTASDVYTAALFLWELLTKRRAFPRTKRKLEMWRAMAEPRLPSLDTLRPELDAALRDAIRMALEPSVADRKISARALAAALRNLVSADEGRERVRALMGMVRHEPSPLLSDVPPATTATKPPPMGAHAAVSPPPAPRVPAPPRPVGLATIVGMGIAPPRAAPRPPVPIAAKAATAVAVDGATAPSVLSSETMPVARDTPALTPELEASGTVVVARPPEPEHELELAAEPEPETITAIAPAPISARVSVPMHVPVPEVAAAPAVDTAAPDVEPDPLPIPARTPNATVKLAVICALVVTAGVGIAIVTRSVRRGSETTEARPAPKLAPAKKESLPKASAPPAPQPSAAPLPAATVPSPPPSAAEPTPEPTATPARAAPDDRAIPSTMGLLNTAGGMAGRRIFVDGRTVGQTPKAVLVKCGERKVQIGSSGRAQLIDVPCGESVTVSDR